MKLQRFANETTKRVFINLWVNRIFCCALNCKFLNLIRIKDNSNHIQIVFFNVNLDHSNAKI